MTFSRICSRCSAVAVALVALVAGLRCSDAGLYALNGRGAGGPDKADFSGVACIPLAAGDAFPVKVLYAVQVGSQGVAPTSSVTDALNSIASRFPLPYISFGLESYHAVATGYAVGPGGSPGSYGAAVDFAAAVTRFGQATNGDGPPSMRAALRNAKAVLSGDMLTSCRGTVARARYLVVLMAASPDTSCANPAFNAGLDDGCTDAGTNDLCSQCELDKATRDLKALVESRGAGEVIVIPIYVPPDPSLPDPAAVADVGAIARAGGSQAVVTSAGLLTSAVNSVNYASLQQSLVLKHLIAFNRNVISQGGQVLVDSDGDGLDDAREAVLGTDPTKYDTDGDGLGDGVEVSMGLDPLVPNIINGCSPFKDGDLDRLNDCEERVLGTDSCVADSDGDTVPDLLEVLSRTNPLDPEDLKDTDGDGASNIDELVAHADPNSDDNDFRSQRSYGYEITDAPATADGRACYQFRIDNITLGNTIERPNPPFLPTPAGMNDIYLYLQVGRANQVHGLGINALNVTQVRFVPPSTKIPSGTIKLTPDDFVTGR